MSLHKFVLRCVAVFYCLSSVMVFASEEARSVSSGLAIDPYRSLAAALAIGLAVAAGAFAQARTASSALDAIARNPAAQGKIFIPMIISLALIESLVIYAFVIAFVKI